MGLLNSTGGGIYTGFLCYEPSLPREVVAQSTLIRPNKGGRQLCIGRTNGRLYWQMGMPLALGFWPDIKR